jgi:hypothetical protein
MDNDLVRALISSINEATAAIPCWDEYAREGKVVACDEDKAGGGGGGGKNGTAGGGAKALLL